MNDLVPPLFEFISSVSALGGQPLTLALEGYAKIRDSWYSFARAVQGSDLIFLSLLLSLIHDILVWAVPENSLFASYIIFLVQCVAVTYLVMGCVLYFTRRFILSHSVAKK